MTPTREDLIQLLTKEPQVGIDALITQFACIANDVLAVLQRHADFERCAPRPQDKPGFAWRLSSLSVDPRVRAAAIHHQRNVEQPPQRRVQYHAMTKHSTLPLQTSTDNVLVAWLTHNPGEWQIAQIAESRGCSIACIRDHLKRNRDRIVARRQQGSPAVLISLRSAEPAA